eukprot:6779350-Pyramimonas_sp.AAC.1
MLCHIWHVAVGTDCTLTVLYPDCTLTAGAGRALDRRHVAVGTGGAHAGRHGRPRARARVHHRPPLPPTRCVRL